MLVLRPADVEECGDVKKKYDLPDDFLLFMATIEPRKNVINLIKAWSIASKKSVELKGWSLVIAGWSQVGHEEELKSLIKKLVKEIKELKKKYRMESTNSRNNKNQCKTKTRD